MKCELCTFLQDQEEGYYQTSFWDINQLLLLNGIPTAAKSLENESPMDGFPTCECMKKTSDCSIHPSTKDAWIALMRASLAKILATQETKQGLERVRDLDFTGKFSAFPMKYDLSTSLWRMSQQSLMGMMGQCSEPLLATLPSVALMRSGVVWQLPKLELGISAIDGGSWATPRANQAMAAELTEKMAQHKHPNLEVQVAKTLWPTPVQSMHKGSSPKSLIRKSGKSRVMDRLDHTVMATDGGKLNPKFVEWLMMWPIGWTFTTGFKKKRKSGAQQQKRKTEQTD